MTGVQTCALPISGAATVILAMGAGKQAAASIAKTLLGDDAE